MKKLLLTALFLFPSFAFANYEIVPNCGFYFYGSDIISYSRQGNFFAINADSFLQINPNCTDSKGLTVISGITSSPTSGEEVLNFISSDGSSIVFSGIANSQANYFYAQNNVPYRITNILTLIQDGLNTYGSALLSIFGIVIILVIGVFLFRRGLHWVFQHKAMRYVKFTSDVYRDYKKDL